MKQLDLFTGKDSEYVESLPQYFSHFDSPGRLERLLVGLNVMDVALFYNLEGRMEKRPKSGNYQGLCPFHKEKTASFFLKPKKNWFACYSCGTSGGPLRLDATLGGKIYHVITEKANLTEVLPYLSLTLLISAEMRQNTVEQREYLAALRQALQWESYDISRQR